MLFTLVVGYFACAQYDVLFFTRHSERSEESHRRTDEHILFTLVVGYFAYAQYDVKSPIGTSCHFPRRRKRVSFYCLCERSEAISREGELPRTFTLFVGIDDFFFKGKSKFYIDGYLRKCLSENLPRVLYNKRIYFASVLKGLYIITNKTRKLAATPQSA